MPSTDFDGDEDHQREHILGEQGQGESDTVEEWIAGCAFGDLRAEAPVEPEPGIRQQDAEQVNDCEPAGYDGQVAGVEAAGVITDGDPAEKVTRVATNGMKIAGT